MSIVYGVQYIIYDAFNDFSSSKATSEFIEEEFSKNSVFVSDTPDINLGVIAYLNDYTNFENKSSNYLFYDLQNERYYTYITWDYKLRTKIEEREFFERIDRLNIKENIYFIHSNYYGRNEEKCEMNTLIKKMEKEGKLEKIFEKMSKVVDESFTIYKVKGMSYDK